MNDRRDLETAAQRFKVAEEGRIDYLGLEWASLQNFLSSIGHYWRLADRKERLSDLQPDLRRLWESANVLTRAPIHPTHDSVGLTEWLTSKFSVRDADLQSARESCVDSVVRLLSEKHPAAALGILLRQMRFLRFVSQNEIALVSQKVHHRAIRESLDTGDFAFRLVAPADLKRSGVWDVAIYLGPQYASFSGTPISLRRSEVAWMYDSPAARQTIQVMWAGENFDLMDYQLWEGIGLKLSTEIGPTRFRTDISELVPSLVMRPASQVAGGVDSFDIDFAEGYRVSYSSEFGPKPHLIETDDFDVDIDAAKVTKLNLGDVLLMRMDSAARSFVQTEARRAMGPHQYDHAIELRDKFKRAIVAASQQSDAETHLYGAGFENPLYYLRVCEDPVYIGPNFEDSYVKLCMALRVEPNVDEYRTFVLLRKFHRQAGITARTVLIERLKLDRAWEELVKEQGFYRASLTDIGEILIAAILRIEKSKASLSTLGRVTKDGRLVD